MPSTVCQTNPGRAQVSFGLPRNGSAWMKGQVVRSGIRCHLTRLESQARMAEDRAQAEGSQSALLLFRISLDP